MKNYLCIFRLLLFILMMSNQNVQANDDVTRLYGEEIMPAPDTVNLIKLIKKHA